MPNISFSKTTFKKNCTINIGIVILFHFIYTNSAFSQIEVVRQKPIQEAKGDTAVKLNRIASFPGSDSLLNYYLIDNFNSGLSVDVEQSEMKTVILTFIVNSFGKISETSIGEPDKQKKPVPISIRNELIRIVANMPDWNPALKNGEKVTSLVYLPLNYKITGGKLFLFNESSLFQAKAKKKISPEKIAIILASIILIGAIAFIGILK